MATIDLKNGIYRRVYSMAIRGKRINSVSLSAEACFWRLHLVADDFGNLEASIDLLLAQAFTRRRSVTEELLRGWLSELVNAGLITPYNDGAESYIHINDFEELQPKGKNGKRVRKYPKVDDPGMSEGILTIEQIRNFQDSPGNIIQVDPNESRESRLHNYKYNEHEHEHEQAQAQNNEQGDLETPDTVEPAFDPVSEAISSGGGSGACSPEPETAQPPAEPPVPTPDYNRDHGFLRWLAAVEPLIGLDSGRRHAPQSAKWNRDVLSVEAWFAERIWPIEIDPGKGHQRLQFAIERAKRAPKESENPIRYLAYHTRKIGTF